MSTNPSMHPDLDPLSPSGVGSNVVRVAFIVICAALALLPLVGMIWAPTDSTSENRELAKMPSLVDSNGVNPYYLSDLGSYFEDHFAYKSLLATIDANVSMGWQMSSDSDTVVLGTNGWLYLAETTDDYLGNDLISPHELENMAYDFRLMRDYCSQHGAGFAVVIPPNKNTLYPHNMPYYLGERGENRTLELLAEDLGYQGVPYYDVLSQFGSDDEVLYFKRDSHWNADGARKASAGLLGMLGHDDAADRISGLSADWVQNHEGDLDVMLFPDNVSLEYDAVFDGQLSWSEVELEEEGKTANTRTKVTMSEEEGAEGTLLMYRDSFSRNMVQFLASSYESAYFVNSRPCDLTIMTGVGATDVIFEIVERNLKLLCAEPATMPALSAAIRDDEIDHGAIDGIQAYDQIGLSSRDGLMVVDGCLPVEYANDDTTDIYVGLEKAGGTEWYLPFKVTISGDSYGYRAFFDNGQFDGTGKISIAVRNGDALKLVQTIR